MAHTVTSDGEYSAVAGGTDVVGHSADIAPGVMRFHVKQPVNQTTMICGRPLSYYILLLLGPLPSLSSVVSSVIA